MSHTSDLNDVPALLEKVQKDLNSQGKSWNWKIASSINTLSLLIWRDTAL